MSHPVKIAARLHKEGWRSPSGIDCEMVITKGEKVVVIKQSIDTQTSRLLKNLNDQNESTTNGD